MKPMSCLCSTDEKKGGGSKIDPALSSEVMKLWEIE